MNVATKITPMAAVQYYLTKDKGYELTEDDETIKKWEEIILNYENLQEELYRRHESARNRHYASIET